MDLTSADALDPLKNRIWFGLGLSVETEDDPNDNEGVDFHTPHPLPFLHQAVEATNFVSGNDPAGVDPVDEDRTDMNCFGVATVYSFENTIARALKLNDQRFPIGSDSLIIAIDGAAKTLYKSVVGSDLDMADLKSRLTAIFDASTPNGAGFPSVKVLDASDSSIATHRAKFKKQASGLWTATNFQGGEKFNEGQGQLVPFFLYFVFSEEVKPDSASEDAHSEMVNTLHPEEFTKTPPQKRVLSPSILTWGRPGQREGLRGALVDGGGFKGIEQKYHTIFLANTIAHEIGHDLGLRHGVYYNNDTDTYEVDPKHPDYLPQGVMDYDPTGTTAWPQWFGPVHKALFKKHYL
jgi:hypothetical protein